MTSVSTARKFGLATLLLVVVLGLLYIKGLVPGRTVFSNDGPLGAIAARSTELPSGFFGHWQDLNWLGLAGPSAAPSPTQLLALSVGKVIYSKIVAPFSLLFVGLSAWICFRLWKFSHLTSTLGALAAALNSDFFSAASWGVVSQPVAIGFTFLALGALAKTNGPSVWARAVLGGFAVGLAVVEAFDIGAIFSLVVASFVVFQALTKTESTGKRLILGFSRVFVVAVAAGFISAATLITLVGTQIKGVAVHEQPPEEKWDWATQWSLSKRETLGIIIPGIFGFRMDTPEGGNYWGIVGRSPAWERYYAGEGPRPAGGHRFGGGGPYAGTLVLLLAAWAIAQSFRKNSPFGTREKRFIWFWGGVAVVALLLSYGRFAPFYQLFYALPMASTIRNPAKFIHVVEFAIVILFAYGLDLLVRNYLAGNGSPTADLKTQLKTWWAKASGFDRKWVVGLVTTLGVGLLGWLVYTGSKAPLMRYLQEVDFDEQTAAAIADFSIRQPLWFLLFFTLSAGIMVLVLSGYFRGKRAMLAGVLLGLILTVDLARANVPWVVTYNWRERYASNPVLDFLRKDAHLHRVALVPFEPPPQQSLLHNLYRLEWAQHQFLFYNIQSLDVVQMPRPPIDMELFEGALRPTNEITMHRLVRRWELTNTRYLLGPTLFVDFLNERFDSGAQRFRAAMRFEIVPKPGVTTPRTFEELTAVEAPEGQYAVIEFSGALPRTAVYNRWKVITNDPAALEVLASKQFDPHALVLVQDPISEPLSQEGTNALAGVVEVTSYAPKEIRLKATVKTDSVLLYNDRYDLNWHVEVDGAAAPLLRANYLMRGVKLGPGEYTVRFHFAPPRTGLYISLASIGVAVLLLGYVAATGRRPKDQEEAKVKPKT